MSTAPRSLAASLATRRNAVVVALLGLVAALTVAIVSRPDISSAIGDGVSQGVKDIKTVAAMLAERSPGERAQGALATLKPKRLSALHERALPKVRTPLAALLTAPPIPLIATPPAVPVPLYNLVTAGPPVLVPAATIFPGAIPIVGPPGGIIPGSPGVIVPPVVTPSTPVTPVIPVTPVTPVTPAVPEPTTWAMMLVGFALIGRALRRSRRTAPQLSA